MFKFLEWLEERNYNRTMKVIDIRMQYLRELKVFYQETGEKHYQDSFNEFYSIDYDELYNELSKIYKSKQCGSCANHNKLIYLGVKI